MTVPYVDYFYKTSNLSAALGAVNALRQAGLIAPRGGPENMLGDVINDADGNPVLRGRQGQPALPYIDPGTSLPAIIPAKGDPAFWYFAVRSNVTSLPFDPATFSLVPADPAEILAVLGAWA